MSSLVPSSERSRAVSYVFGGLDLGSVVGLLLCGPLIAKFGWPSVFYVFGALGLAWAVMWPLAKPTQVDPLVQKEREIMEVKDEERRQQNAEDAGTTYVAKDNTKDGPVRFPCPCSHSKRHQLISFRLHLIIQLSNTLCLLPPSVPPQALFIRRACLCRFRTGSS